MPKKLIVILGQTASGKTDLSLALARQFNGEIVSADSRQVYRGLDIGSGKVTKKEMAKIPHYLLDVASPKKKFSVAQFQKLAMVAIKKIHQKNKIPFLVGGTGFYIQSVTQGISIPDVKPNPALRKKLFKKSPAELFSMLKKIDPERAKNIDAKNPIRLIRAIEIVTATKKPVPKIQTQKQFEVLQIGILKSKPELQKLIAKRLQKRVTGIIKEVKNLRAQGLSFKRLEELGLEYKYAALYLQEKINKTEMINLLQKEIEHFAKRQMTWFKKDSTIFWIKNQRQAEKLIKTFLKS
jgi:tRNA dimethylallyltransferase